MAEVLTRAEAEYLYEKMAREERLNELNEDHEWLAELQAKLHRIAFPAQ